MGSHGGYRCCPFPVQAVVATGHECLLRSQVGESLSNCCYTRLRSHFEFACRFACQLSICSNWRVGREVPMEWCACRRDAVLDASKGRLSLRLHPLSHFWKHTSANSSSSSASAGRGNNDPSEDSPIHPLRNPSNR